MRADDFESFWLKLEAILGSMPSSSVVFNQYIDCNPNIDLPDAAAIRKANLKAYLERVANSATVLVVGEAAGPWGTRFSGVPFTGERQLINQAFPIDGYQSSKGKANCPTMVEPPYISRSAEVFWQIMLPYYPHFLTWDAFPLHSHAHDNVLSVRNPTAAEVAHFEGAIRLINEYLKPNHIIAVGRKASRQLEAIGVTAAYVRHPSRGGQARFSSEMQRLFEAEISVPAI